MNQKLAQHILLPSGNESFLWNVYHENSKNSVFQLAHTDEEIKNEIANLAETLDFEGLPFTLLPDPVPTQEMSLIQAILSRESALALQPKALNLGQLSTLLYFGYGTNRNRAPLGTNRHHRTVPSAGALFPLEIFFYTAHVTGLEPGLYHFNPVKHGVRCLRRGDFQETITELAVQPELAKGASLLIFIAGVFERTIMKYGDRGYRFILLEAGHVAQNMSLLANGLGLGCVTIGGFYDRLVDDFLGFDGVTHSGLYLVGMGDKK